MHITFGSYHERQIGNVLKDFSIILAQFFCAVKKIIGFIHMIDRDQQHVARIAELMRSSGQILVTRNR